MTRADAGLGYCRRGVLLLLGLCVSLAGWAGGDVYAADVDAHATAASTASANTPKAADVVEQRLRSELRLLLLDLVQSGAFGDVPVERISLDRARAARRAPGRRRAVAAEHRVGLGARRVAAPHQPLRAGASRCRRCAPGDFLFLRRATDRSAKLRARAAVDRKPESNVLHVDDQ